MMRVLSSVLWLGCVAAAYAGGVGVPGTIAHQGVIAVHGERFTGQGEFRFALVNAETDAYLWVNDGSAVANPDPPTDAVILPVINGVYNVRLGDEAIGNMTAIPPALFHDNDNVALRIWFDDARGNGTHRLAPDQPISSVPFAHHSATIDDDAVTSVKIADGQVGNVDLADNAVNSAKIQDGTVIAADLATNSVNSAEIASGAVNTDEIANNAVTSAKIASDAASLNRVSGGTMWSVGGSVGIGTNDPIGYQLRVKGNVCITGNLCVDGAITATGPITALVCGIDCFGCCAGPSDRRLKDHIKPIAGGLEKVTRLRGVSFQWRRDEFPKMNFRDGQQIGLIAQEVAEVLPEVVVSNADGYKGIQYGKVVAVLVEAIKEQQQMINSTRSELGELKQRLAAVERAVGVEPKPQRANSAGLAGALTATALALAGLIGFMMHARSRRGGAR
ncbi:MAG: tail fiber domain-containing protein [Phycisphaerae bacterium]